MYLKYSPLPGMPQFSSESTVLLFLLGLAPSLSMAGESQWGAVDRGA